MQLFAKSRQSARNMNIGKVVDNGKESVKRWAVEVLADKSKCVKRNWCNRLSLDEIPDVVLRQAFGIN